MPYLAIWVTSGLPTPKHSKCLRVCRVRSRWVQSPRGLDAALEALRGATDATRVLAGGTDLLVELQTGRTAPDRVVDVWRVDELRGIRDEDRGLRLGALTTCTELLRDPRVGARADILCAAAAEVGGWQIQNRATLGGNLGTASPAADLNPVLLVLGAVVRLASAADGVRAIIRVSSAGWARTRTA